MYMYLFHREYAKTARSCFVCPILFFYFFVFSSFFFEVSFLVVVLQVP